MAGPGPAAADDGFLVIDGLTKNFGGLRAVGNVSFTVGQGQLVAVIGPNGAGKTTRFNLVTGVYPPSGGRIAFRGHALGALAPHRVTALGVARTYQNIRLFKGMSVLDNILVGTTAVTMPASSMPCSRRPGPATRRA